MFAYLNKSTYPFAFAFPDATMYEQYVDMCTAVVGPTLYDSGLFEARDDDNSETGPRRPGCLNLQRNSTIDHQNPDPCRF